MQSELKRTMGKWNLISLGVGCIVGGGIFAMTGPAIYEHAGPAIIFSFLIAGLACAFAGLCYAELASLLPVSGSAYTYAYATLGEVVAWCMGWLLILEYGLASSTVAVSWSGYFISFLADLGVAVAPEWAFATGLPVVDKDGVPILGENGEQLVGKFNLVAAIGAMVVAAILTLGVKESVRFNNIMVFLKVGVLLLFVGVGITFIDVDNWSPLVPAPGLAEDQYGWSGVFRAASIIFFAYIGFEAISTAAQEAKDPQKNMPFGIIGSLLVCTVLYILVSSTLTGIIPFNDPAMNSRDTIAVAVDRTGIDGFALVIKAGAVLGITSVMMVLIYGQTRIFYIMSRDGLLPRFFSTVHPKLHTPWINTLLVGAVVALAAGLTPIRTLGDLVSLGTLSAFTIVCIAVLYLRWKEPDLERPFRVPFAPYTPIMGILICGYLILQMPGEIFLKLKFFFLTGIIIYLVYGQFKSRLHREMNPRPGDPEFVKEEHETRTE